MCSQDQTCGHREGCLILNPLVLIIYKIAPAVIVHGRAAQGVLLSRTGRAENKTEQKLWVKTKAV